MEVYDWTINERERGNLTSCLLFENNSKRVNKLAKFYLHGGWE